MKDLCIIMSVYKNSEISYLRTSIESVLNQTYTNFDFYIQLDGPVYENVYKYLIELVDSRVFLNYRKENRGLAFSLNELLNRVLPKEYTYIARMDADDICIKDRFEKQLHFMEKNVNIDVSGGSILEIDSQSQPLGKIRYPLDHNKMKIFFGKRNPLAHPTVIFRKTFFEKAGFYPINTILDEDTILWLNGFKNNCVFGNIEDVLLMLRIDSDFYDRRNGFKKSYHDLKDRLLVIRSLNLSHMNYFWAIMRFVVLCIPFSTLTRLAYRYLRN